MSLPESHYREKEEESRRLEVLALYRKPHPNTVIPGIIPLNIAVLFMGVVRPSIEVFLENKKHLLESLGSQHKVDTFLFSWEQPNSLNIQKDKYVDICVLKKEDELDRVLEKYKGCDGKIRNHYKTFIRNRESILTVQNLGKKYDFFVYCRPDLCTKFNADLDGWYNVRTYNLPTNGSGSIGGFNWCHDQFGIATPEIMFKAWDYGTLDNLHKTYWATFVPEHCMCKIQSDNGIERTAIEMADCRLIR